MIIVIWENIAMVTSVIRVPTAGKHGDMTVEFHRVPNVLPMFLMLQNQMKQEPMSWTGRQKNILETYPVKQSAFVITVRIKKNKFKNRALPGF